MPPFLVVFLGAGFGGMLRHAMNLGMARLTATGFPFGTLAINVSGSFAMGLFAAWFALRADPGQSWRLFLTTGLLGGYTTFSAFSLDAGILFERGAILPGFLYVLGSVGLSLTALFAAMALVRLLP